MLIATQRPEAARYNGMRGAFVRKVTDGPAFDPHVHQVIVHVENQDLYFFASEVRPENEDEADDIREQMETADRRRDRQERRAKEAHGRKVEMLEKASQPAQRKDGDQGAEGSKRDSTAAAADLGDDRHRFNRLPTDRPERPNQPPLADTPVPSTSNAQSPPVAEPRLPQGAQPGGATVQHWDQPQNPVRVAGQDDKDS
jgi:hypothetical protein